MNGVLGRIRQLIRAELRAASETARTDSRSLLTAAFVVSALFYPLVVPVQGGVLLLYVDGLTLTESAAWIGLYVGLTALPLTGYVLVMRFRWNQSTLVRAHRQQFYGFGVVLAVGLMAVFSWLDAPEILLVATLSAVVAGVLFGICNRRTKVSLHVGVIFGVALLLWIVNPVAGLVGLGCTLLVGGSRYLLGRHTPFQMILSLGIVSVSVGLAYGLL